MLKQVQHDKKIREFQPRITNIRSGEKPGIFISIPRRDVKINAG
jgi:hypothetical protein